jgi:hypothetical protein
MDLGQASRRLEGVRKSIWALARRNLSVMSALHRRTGVREARVSCSRGDSSFWESKGSMGTPLTVSDSARPAEPVGSMHMRLCCTGTVPGDSTVQHTIGAANGDVGDGDSVL